MKCKEESTLSKAANSLFYILYIFRVEIDDFHAQLWIWQNKTLHYKPI